MIITLEILSNVCPVWTQIVANAAAHTKADELLEIKILSHQSLIIWYGQQPQSRTRWYSTAHNRTHSIGLAQSICFSTALLSHQFFQNATPSGQKIMVPLWTAIIGCCVRKCSANVQCERAVENEYFKSIILKSTYGYFVSTFSRSTFRSGLFPTATHVLSSMAIGSTE